MVGLVHHHAHHHLPWLKSCPPLSVIMCISSAEAMPQMLAGMPHASVARRFRSRRQRLGPDSLHRRALYKRIFESVARANRERFERAATKPVNSFKKSHVFILVTDLGSEACVAAIGCSKIDVSTLNITSVESAPIPMQPPCGALPGVSQPTVRLTNSQPCQLLWPLRRSLCR